MNHSKTYQCIIIGSGFSGICLAIKLKRHGIDDFIILEKAAEVGGTWRDNNYPGAECDVPSALYSYSFENKTDWDYQWSEQPQILEYIKNTARKNGIMDHIRFASELLAADYDAGKGHWALQLANGETLTSQFLVSAVGQLHKPRVPEYKGIETFTGARFHSANWVSQKRDRPYKAWEKRLMRLFPFSTRIARLKIYLRNELIAYHAIKGNRVSSWLVKMACLNYLNSTVTDESLRQKLLPDYPIGAKRILIADGYYEALIRDNVELITDHWSTGARAYLGIATSEFPNLFFTYGPNTNLGHNSILLMAEVQADYINQAMDYVERNNASALELRQDIEERYNIDLQARLQRMVWNSVVDSWYKSGGRITNNWPGSVGEYRNRTRTFQAADYVVM